MGKQGKLLYSLGSQRPARFGDGYRLMTLVGESFCMYMAFSRLELQPPANQPWVIHPDDGLLAHRLPFFFSDPTPMQSPGSRVRGVLGEGLKNGPSLQLSLVLFLLPMSSNLLFAS